MKKPGVRHHSKRSGTIAEDIDSIKTETDKALDKLCELNDDIELLLDSSEALEWLRDNKDTLDKVKDLSELIDELKGFKRSHEYLLLQKSVNDLHLLKATRRKLSAIYGQNLLDGFSGWWNRTLEKLKIK